MEAAARIWFLGTRVDEVGIFRHGFQRRLHGCVAAFCLVSVATLAAGIPLRKDRTMKVLLWIVGIIFLVGLLVVTGVLKLIF